MEKERLAGALTSREVARHFPADQIDPDGMYATSCAWTEAIGYNTSLVKREEAPKSYADLLDPKWMGKMVKRIQAIAAPS